MSEGPVLPHFQPGLPFVAPDGLLVSPVRDLCFASSGHSHVRALPCVPDIGAR